MSEDTLWLKFSGDELDVRSVPIYELGEVLVAVQRIIHKAHLWETDRLRGRARISRTDRQKLALQIRDRRKSSDLFALTPFLSDSAIQAYVATLIKTGVSALAKYALKSVLGESDSKPGSPITQEIAHVEGSMLSGAIYAESVQITNHINNIGGVEKISFILGDPQGVSSPAAVFTPETQAYVRDLANSRVFGERATIEGLLTKIHTSRQSVEIRLEPSPRRVEVHLNPRDYEDVRYRTHPGDMLRFHGRPLIRLQRSERTYDEFEADTLEVFAFPGKPVAEK